MIISMIIFAQHPSSIVEEFYFILTCFHFVSCLFTGYWSPWTNWTECMDICDSGEEKRFRECLSDNSTVVFPECVGGGPYVETRSCGVPTGQGEFKHTTRLLLRIPVGVVNLANVDS